MPLVGPLSPLEKIDLYTWSLNRRTLKGKPFSIIPPYKAIYRDQSMEMYVEKAAQLFFSEYLITLAFFAADVKWGDRGVVAYYFPSEKQLNDYSIARLDPEISSNPYLAQRTANRVINQKKVKTKQNVQIKQVGDGFIYFRGSQNRRQVISVDADVVIFDEVDEMADTVIEAGKIRAQSSLHPFYRGGSTPKYPNRGIDSLIQRSTNKTWMVKCSRCGYEHDLALVHDWIRPLSGVKQSQLTIDYADEKIGTNFHRGKDYYVGCPSCAHISNVWNGRWVNQRELSSPNVDHEGYHLPKLFSNRLAGELFDSIAKTVEREREGKLSEAATQEFYNSVCGLPRAPQGVQCSLEHLQACQPANNASPVFNQFYTAYDGDWKRCFMGVDVGQNILHVTVIGYPRDNASLYEMTGGRDVPVLLFAGSPKEFEELPPIFKKYDCLRGVIDNHPEYRKTMELCKAFPYRIYAGHYAPGWANKGANLYVYDEDDLESSKEFTYSVTMGRSECLELMFDYVFKKNIVLPYPIHRVGGLEDDSGFGQFPRHLMALTRIVDDGSVQTLQNGQLKKQVPTGKVIYINTGDDHFAHSLTYALVAAKATRLDNSSIPVETALQDLFFGVKSAAPEKSAPVFPGLGVIRGNQQQRGFYGQYRQGTTQSRPTGY